MKSVKGSEIIVFPKNRKEEKLLKTFLASLSIDFYVEEDVALHTAMVKGRKTKLLNKKEQLDFIKNLQIKPNKC